jgi:peptide/nickel transport system permease protein
MTVPPALLEARHPSAMDEGGLLPLPRTSPWRWLVGRLLTTIPLVLGVATVLFFVVNLAPGDPVSTLSSPSTSPEALERNREILGLDAPVHIRYLRWIGGFATGDMGVSHVSGQPVLGLFLEILPNTLLLSGLALLLSYGLGMLLGVIQAVREGSALDRMLSLLTLTLYSVPSFWLAVMLVLVFSYLLGPVWGWPVSFPASGMVSVDHEFLSLPARVWDRVVHLVLPTATLVAILGSGVARFTRASMVDVLHQEYIRAARSRGIPRRTVVLRHALPNTLLPLVALLGLQLPLLIGGTVFVEVVFGWPGMGKLLVDAILQRDYPVIMGGSFLFAVAVVLANLLADVLAVVADPRIRMEERR